jgi:hypothetical protein
MIALNSGHAARDADMTDLFTAGWSQLGLFMNDGWLMYKMGNWTYVLAGLNIVKPKF